jgi:hypothetical protein
MASIESTNEDGAGSSNSFQVETNNTTSDVPAFSLSSSDSPNDEIGNNSDDRRGQKHKRGSDGSDTAPRMPRRMQSGQDDGSSSVISHHDDADASDSEDIMDHS